MSKFTDEQIKAMFDKFDVNKDGRISRNEVDQVITELGLKSDKALVDKFIDAVDTDKDGMISLEEFRFFVTFKTTALADFDSLLLLTSQSMALMKKLISAKQAHTADENSSIHVVVKDKSIESIESLSSVLELLAGDVNKNQELRRALQKPLEYQNALVFTFKVADKQTVLKNLPGHCEELKALLYELGNAYKDLIDSLNFEFVETEVGVQMIIDLTQNPIVQAFVQSSHHLISQLENFPVEVVARMGTDFDLKDYNKEAEQLLMHRYVFDILLNTFNLSILMGVEEIKSSIKSYVEAKDYSAASGLITLLSLKNINLELDFDDKLRGELKHNLKVENKDTILLDLANQAREGLEGSGMMDFVEAMPFIKGSIKDLKEAGLSEVGVFVKIRHLHCGLNIKGNSYSFLNHILKLD